jgi:hypothetical protein
MRAGANPALLYDIGRSYELMGKKLEAAEIYEKYGPRATSAIPTVCR